MALPWEEFGGTAVAEEKPPWEQFQSKPSEPKPVDVGFGPGKALPVPEGAPGYEEFAATPKGQAALDILRPPPSEPGESVLGHLERVKPQEGVVMQTLGGLSNVAAGTAEALTTPASLALLPTTAVRGVGRLAGLLFGAQAASDIPEAARETFAPDRTLQQRIESGGRTLTDILFGAAGLGHGTGVADILGRRETPVSTPATDAVLQQIEKPATLSRPAAETQPTAVQEAGTQPLGGDINAQKPDTAPSSLPSFEGKPAVAQTEGQVQEGIAREAPTQEIAEPFPSLLQSAEDQRRIELRQAAEAPPVSSAEQAPAETVQPNDFTPAIRTKEGELIQGEKGQTHDDIIKAQPDPTAVRADDPEHVFVDKNGEVKTREQVSQALGETEPMQSDRLRELQAEKPATPTVPESAISHELASVESRSEPTTSIGDVRTPAAYEAMGIRTGEPEIADKIVKSVDDAAQAISKPIVKSVPASIESPKIDLRNGSSTPPPPESVFAPNTPPDGDPVPIYATRVNNSFRRWWERFWPRDLAVSRVQPDSPVITEHQNILKVNQDYMQNFSHQDWWKSLRSRSNDELIDLEDQAVKDYHSQVANGVDPKQAYESAVSKMPEDFRAIIRYRESRVPIEKAAAEVLGVDPPKYTSEPYISRLTNEEGKDVVDLNPRVSNIGKQIRTTIGSFDNSRVHLTMKDGISEGTQYEPVSRAVWLRELNSTRLESTANLVSSLKDKGVLFDSKKAAYEASPEGKISLVRGLGGNQYWARSPQEAVFLEQNISTVPSSPLGRLQQLANTYVRNPSLVNPLPHVTKNMFFKYAMARVNNATFRADVAEFSQAAPSGLKSRFDSVMPFVETGERLPQLTAKEVGTWAEKTMTGGLKINNPSSQFIFGKADPAMRYSLWKSYVRKGMDDQEAANHVWIDLIRYDANSGGMNFWKSIPFNFFVPWRTGTYVTIAKALTSHPLRTLAFIGAVEYMREIRYRQTGKWTHLPVDYIDTPLAEAIDSATKVKDVKTAGKAAEMSAMTAATTLVFGPGGGQAPNTIKDLMSALQNDPQNKARIMNMFWGLSQIYNLPREWQAYQRDGEPRHLVNLLTTAALAEHSALKYEPRRLMKWLPDWMPGMQKSNIVSEAEQLRNKIESTRSKQQVTYEQRHGISSSYERSPEEQQLEELQRASGIRTGTTNRGRSEP
jgi:hypothetical protein